MSLEVESPAEFRRIRRISAEKFLVLLNSYLSMSLQLVSY